MFVSQVLFGLHISWLLIRLQNSVKLSSTEQFFFNFCFKYVCMFVTLFLISCFQKVWLRLYSACPNNCNCLSVFCKSASTKKQWYVHKHYCQKGMTSCDARPCFLAVYSFSSTAFVFITLDQCPSSILCTGLHVVFIHFPHTVQYDTA